MDGAIRFSSSPSRRPWPDRPCEQHLWRPGNTAKVGHLRTKLMACQGLNFWSSPPSSTDVSTSEVGREEVAYREFGAATNVEPHKPAGGASQGLMQRRNLHAWSVACGIPERTTCSAVFFSVPTAHWASVGTRSCHSVAFCQAQPTRSAIASSPPRQTICSERGNPDAVNPFGTASPHKSR